MDFDNPVVAEFFHESIVGKNNDLEKAVAMYYRVRDGIFYNPYVSIFQKEFFKAGYSVQKKKNFCIPKAILLATGCRLAGIPARLGFADVKNHLMSEKLERALRSDIVRFHGYTDIYLEGKWVKATPAFNVRLCRAFKIEPLDFNGKEDAIFHPFSTEGDKHMEYLHDHGTFAEMPYNTMLEVYKQHYPHWFEKEFASLKTFAETPGEDDIFLKISI